jgi:hypothetical protein
VCTKLHPNPENCTLDSYSHENLKRKGGKEIKKWKYITRMRKRIRPVNFEKKRENRRRE